MRTSCEMLQGLTVPTAAAGVCAVWADGGGDRGGGGARMKRARTRQRPHREIADFPHPLPWIYSATDALTQSPQECPALRRRSWAEMRPRTNA